MCEQPRSRMERLAATQESVSIDRPAVVRSKEDSGQNCVILRHATAVTAVWELEDGGT